MATDEYRLEQLANGQRLVTEKLDHLRSICLGFWIPAGSRDEPAALYGASHFIEHLLFKGSSKYTAEEIAMVEDSPQDLIHDVLAEVVLDGHPLAHPILGTRESIAGASHDDIRDFHRQLFGFSNMVVAAAGNVDHDQVRELLLQKQGVSVGQSVERSQAVAQARRA